jgi:hypothetical protein
LVWLAVMVTTLKSLGWTLPPVNHSLTPLSRRFTAAALVLATCGRWA